LYIIIPALSRYNSIHCLYSSQCDCSADGEIYDEIRENSRTLLIHESEITFGGIAIFSVCCVSKMNEHKIQRKNTYYDAFDHLLGNG
jgi:hypothetical protein